MSAPDALAVLKKVPLFSALDAGEIKEVVAKTTIVHIDPGAEVFADGTAGDAMYVVIVGEVEIVKGLPGGGVRILASLGPRSVFGEMSLLTEEERSAAARAKNACKLLKIDRAAFRERLAGHDPAALKMTAHLAQVIAGRLHAMNEEIVKLLAERGSPVPGNEPPTVPLYDIAEASERVMMQWKI